MIFLTGGLCSILLVEALLYGIENTPLWQVLPVVERELGLPDAEIGYRFQANHEIINIRENRARVKTNTLGMRDTERALSKPANSLRIAVMGDSFTEALQVEMDDTFTAQTEARLNHAARNSETPGENLKRHEVLNFGMSGFGPLQQLLHYKKNGIALDPDLIVFVIGANDFLSQELSNDASGPAYVDNAAGGLEIGYGYRNLRSHQIAQSRLGQVFFWAMDNSRITRAAYLHLKVGNQVMNPIPYSMPGCKGIEQALEPHEELWSHRQPLAAANRLAKLLEDISSLNSNSGSRPISFALYGLLMPQAQCVRQKALREQLIASIEATLSSHNITLLDVESGLANIDKQTYAEREFQGFGTTLGHGHLNVQGHLAFAELLAKHIELRID